MRPCRKRRAAIRRYASAIQGANCRLASARLQGGPAAPRRYPLGLASARRHPLSETAATAGIRSSEHLIGLLGTVPHGKCCRGRLPVGRRRQGQDRRLAVRAGRHRRPLPGRPQCRPHAGDQRHHLQALAAALRRGAAGEAVDHRQRCGARSARADRRDRTAQGTQGVSGHAGQSAHRREHAADPAAASRARRDPRIRQCGDPHRHHAPRHRPGLRGQSRPARDPPDGPRRLAPRSTARSSGCSPITTRCAAASRSSRSRPAPSATD